MNVIGRGRTADIYEYSKDTIIKLYKNDFPEDYINQEFLISKFVHSVGVHTPQPVKCVQVDGRKGIIFNRVAGTSLLKMMAAKIWLIRKYARMLASLHVELHTYHADETLRRQKEVMSDSIKAAPALTEEEKSRIFAYLARLPDGTRLCHGDFHPDNVLVGEEQCWMIDWMTGMSGHPAGD